MAEYEALQTGVRWTTESPAIYLNFYVQHYKEGADQYYQLKATVNPLNSPSYFGYPILVDITANVSPVYTLTTGAVLKAAAPSGPTSWSDTKSIESVLFKYNGTTALNVSFRVYSQGSARNVTYSYNLPLDQGEADFSTASTGTLGKRQKVTCESNGLRVSIVASAGGHDQELAFWEVLSGDFYWTPDMAFAAGAPNGTTVSVDLTCITWSSSGSRLGTKTLTVSMTIPDTVKPSVSDIKVSDATGAATTYGGYLQQVSQLLVKTTGAGVYGSTITGYEVTVSGVGTYSGQEITSGVLMSAGTVTITATITDSRGRTGSASTTVNVMAYQAPSLVSISAIRVNAAGVPTPDGDRGQATFSAQVMALNNKNTASYVFLYRLRGSTFWNRIELPDLAGRYTVTDAVVTFPAATDYAYELAVEITDNFKAPVSTILVLSTAFVLAQATADGTGLAIGERATKSNTLQIGLATIFDGSVQGQVYGLGDLPLIPSGSDLNSYTAPGSYSTAMGSLLNMPAGINSQTGVLYVSYGNGIYSDTVAYIRQVFWPADNASIYLRTLSKVNGAWTYGAWRKLYTYAV